MVLTVWCVGWAAVAGVGLWRYARVWSSHTVRVAARVERVEEPRGSGADAAEGVQVVLAFQNPATGEELRLPTTGARNGTLTAAWVGRPVTVRFPAGHPYDFRIANGMGRQRDLALPVVAACFAWMGLVAHFALDEEGIGWVPLGIGTVVASLTSWAALTTHREGRRREGLLAAAEATTARVVASLQSTHRDDDGHTHTTYVPVMAFTTADGRSVTAVSPAYTSRSQPHTVGTDVAVRYAPADPSVFAFDLATDRRANGCGTAFLTVLAAAGVAAMVTGVVLLS
ncbi:DUF3592 domain-containing protein [Streptomyces cocklensis]|nr:DUF3592 domain-containing protein [Actinacidiphila cocklensis]MDD1063009.1 DUF3592 domain-containing protein [Actinacidiphila cocklensis]WSX82013.1 DUF3592 domain-containing protein [Streptomyces sp. NBC_00899]